MAAQFAAVITNLHRVQVERPGMSVGPLHSGRYGLRLTPTKNLLETHMVGHKFKILLTPIKLKVDFEGFAINSFEARGPMSRLQRPEIAQGTG